MDFHPIFGSSKYQVAHEKSRDNTVHAHALEVTAKQTHEKATSKRTSKQLRTNSYGIP